MNILENIHDSGKNSLYLEADRGKCREMHHKVAVVAFNDRSGGVRPGAVVDVRAGIHEHGQTLAVTVYMIFRLRGTCKIEHADNGFL